MSASETTAALLGRLERGETTSTALTESLLDRVAQHDESIGSFLTVNGETALETAAAIDAKRAAGERVGRLAGLPVALKDILCTKGEPTTCGSRMLEHFVPPYDAHVVERLRAEDAVLIGRTNMDEFAMDSSTENSAFQPTRNPWDTSRSPGGSSGGSAACVAAGFAPLSVGTDTGGSIRQPAAFCGVVGMKPTYGRVSRYGLVAFASSLDQIGPFAHDVHGAALLLEALAGPDERDATCIDRPVPEYTKSLDEPLAGLRVGIVPDHFGEGLDGEVDEAVREAINVYAEHGAKIVEIDLPHQKYSVAVYYLIAPSEASSNLARYDGVHYGRRAEEYTDLVDMYVASRSEAFGPEVKRRILLGTFALSEGYSDQYYNTALRVRRLIRRDFDAAFEKCDVILGPTTPTPAFGIGELVDDPLAMYLNDVYTIAANLAGLPAISLPCGFTKSGLPIGLHLQAPPFEEEGLLQAARTYERTTHWHERRTGLD